MANLTENGIRVLKARYLRRDRLLLFVPQTQGGSGGLDGRRGVRAGLLHEDI
ncbi:MAG: hypothetical protein U5R49_26650 [Deltaproteobacteria bacterium]|nr:hypothetical protein [Deltaproteobacteria bacterium]